MKLPASVVDPRHCISRCPGYRSRTAITGAPRTVSRCSHFTTYLSWETNENLI